MTQTKHTTGASIPRKIGKFPALTIFGNATAPTALHSRRNSHLEVNLKQKKINPLLHKTVL